MHHRFWYTLMMHFLLPDYPFPKSLIQRIIKLTITKISGLYRFKNKINPSSCSSFYNFFWKNHVIKKQVHFNPQTERLISQTFYGIGLRAYCAKITQLPYPLKTQSNNFLIQDYKRFPACKMEEKQKNSTSFSI